MNAFNLNKTKQCATLTYLKSAVCLVQVRKHSYFYILCVCVCVCLRRLPIKECHNMYLLKSYDTIANRQDKLRKLAPGLDNMQIT